MIRDEVLRFAHELSDLADAPVAAGQMAEKLPPQRVRDQLQELERRLVGRSSDHVSQDISNQIDMSI